MTLSEYHQLATRTVNDLGSSRKNETHMYLGLLSETGEFLDTIKKHFAYGDNLDRVNLIEELGDTAWFVVCFAKFLGVDLSELDEDVIQQDMIAHHQTYDDNRLETDKESLTIDYFLTLHEAFERIYKRDGTHRRDFILIFHAMFQYLYAIAMIWELDIHVAFQRNIQKLSVRYPNKFKKKDALNRNLKKERQSLQNS